MVAVWVLKLSLCWALAGGCSTVGSQVSIRRLFFYFVLFFWLNVGGHVVADITLLKQRLTISVARLRLDPHPPFPGFGPHRPLNLTAIPLSLLREAWWRKPSPNCANQDGCEI